MRFFVRSYFLTFLITLSFSYIGTAFAGNIVPGKDKARFYDTGSRINFGLSQGNIEVSDSRITGDAWSEEWGWIRFWPNGSSRSTAIGVKNNGSGTLSGLAWGENLGWVNFSPTKGGVRIDENGYFSGFAWSQNGGWIEFDCANSEACVQTTWTPPDDPPVEPPPGGGGSPRDPDPSPEPEEPVEPEEPEEPLEPPFIPEPETPPTTPADPRDPSDPSQPTPPSTDDPIEEPPVEEPEESEEPSEEPEKETPSPAAPTDPSEKEPPSIREKIIDIIPEPIVSTALAVIAAVPEATSLLASAVLSLRGLGDFGLLAQKLWNLILAIFGFRKKRLPWGTVYDSITKQPLDPAYVQLIDVTTGKEAEGAITDLDGRYGFLPKEGRYILRANKTNYSFPSERLRGRMADVIYDNLYFGEEIAIDSEDEGVIRNIPLDPIEKDWNEVQKRKKGLFNFYTKYDTFFYSISSALFYLGLGLAIAMMAFYPSIFHLIVLIIYVVLVVLRLITSAKQRLGTIMYKDGQPLSYGLVRIFLAESETEIKKVVANENGKFYSLVTPASYFVKIFERIDEEEYREVYTSETFYAQNGLIDKRFKI